MSRFRPLRKNNLTPLLALGFAAGLLAACSSASTVTDMIPPAAGGLPANIPARPATEEYPAVNALPQRREAVPLTDEEIKRAQAELTTLRQQQEERAGTAPKSAAPPAKKDAAARKPAKKNKDAKPAAELTAKDPAK